MGWSEEDERQEQVILGRIETATRHMRDRAGNETAWGVGKCCRGLAPVSECECEKPLAAYRLLREALDRSEREGDFTAAEIAWRAEVRAVLGIDPDETNRS